MSADARREGRRAAAVWLAGCAIVAALAWLAYRAFLDVGLLGIDTYPMILAGRIRSWSDFLGTFTEELMDGMYTDGHFYRPVANLAIAFDYALYGLAPRGYHVTDLVILVVNALLLSALARKLFGAQGLPSAIGAFVVALVFALHPVHLELLPVPARRADTLCLTFLLACLLAQVEPAARASRARTLGVFGLALAAVGAKETGVILLPLVFAFHALRPGGPQASLAMRLRHAGQRCAPVLAALVVFVVARTWVLGKLGGHDESSLGELAGLATFVEPYLLRVVFTQPVFGADQALTRGALWGVFVVLVLATVALWRWTGTSVVSERARTRGGLAFLGIWTLCLLGVSALAGRVHDWYAMLFVAPYAVLLGQCVRRALELSGKKALPLGALLLGASLPLVGLHLAYSALLRDYPGWRRGSELADAQLARYRDALASARAGQTVLLDRFFPSIPHDPRTVGIRSVFLHGEYTLEAYTALVMPGVEVQVDFHGSPRVPLPAPPAPPLRHIVVYPGSRADFGL